MKLLRISKPMLCGAALFAVVALVAPRAFAAAVVAKADGVSVFAEASDKSAVVATMKSGQVLPAVERKGMFWQVKTSDGKLAFVSILKVNHKPDAGADSFANAVRKAVKDGRDAGEETDANRARSAVMGVRGLKPSEASEAAANTKPNMRMVYEMEDRIVAKERVAGIGDEIVAEIERKAKAAGN